MPRSKSLWMLVLGFMAVHLALALSLPLIEDEAYYQLWARYPSAGYYDHPPMIAWWIAGGQWLAGETLLGVRLVPIIASAIVTLLTWRIAWLYSTDDQVAFRAALWGKAMLLFAALGFVATPDPASVLFWTAAIWALVELLMSRSANWWLLVGLFAGLGVLSKFTNLFFGLSLVIWLFASREGRRWLPHWQVWAGAAVGIAVLLPFLLWNLQKDWVGFERQFGRIGPPAGFDAGDFSMFWVSFILLLTPLVAWLVIRGLAKGNAPGALIWLTVPILLYMTYHAAISRAGPQWLAPVYPTLAVIAALGLPHGWVARWAAPTGFVLAGLVLAIGFWPGQSLVGGHTPFTQIRGWERTIKEVRALAKNNSAVWVVTDAYGLTGQLHHYLAPHGLPVWPVTEPERYLFLPDLPAEFCNAPGLFISRADFGAHVPYFRESETLMMLERSEGGKVLMRYHTARVSGLEGCG